MEGFFLTIFQNEKLQEEILNNEKIILEIFD
jgi:hypothetical protein